MIPCPAEPDGQWDAASSGGLRAASRPACRGSSGRALWRGPSLAEPLTLFSQARSHSIASEVPSSSSSAWCSGSHALAVRQSCRRRQRDRVLDQSRKMISVKQHRCDPGPGVVRHKRLAHVTDSCRPGSMVLLETPSMAPSACCTQHHSGTAMPIEPAGFGLTGGEGAAGRSTWPQEYRLDRLRRSPSGDNRVTIWRMADKRPVLMTAWKWKAGGGLPGRSMR